jgi:hypothetical protein
MAEEFTQINQVIQVLTDVSVKLRDMEEKQNILKDRVLMLGENLVSEKEQTNQEILETKNKLNEIEAELKKLRGAIERIIDDTGNVVRRNEFDILKRQFEMFAPLDLARISDVEEIVKNALKNTKQQN